MSSTFSSAPTTSRPREHGRWPSRRVRRALPWMAGGVLLMALATLGAQGRLNSPWGDESGRVDTACRLDRSACEARFADGAVSVQMQRVSLAPSAPARFRLDFTGRSPRSVTLDLNGNTMNMGPNQIALERQADGTWEGELALSACVSGRMTWVATLRAEAGAGAWTARFLFDSGG